jgi:hypothetical protein
MFTALEKYRLWTLSSSEFVVPKNPRNINDPIYSQKIAVEITGIDDDVLRQWQYRGVLERAELDGDLTPQKGRSYVRRSYSVTDLLKLCVMQELIFLGARLEVAAQAPALLGKVVLTDERRKALARGEILYSLLQFPRTGDSLGLVDLEPDSRGVYFLPGMKPKDKPVQWAPSFLIGWGQIQEQVFQKLKEIDQREGEIS